MFDDMFPNKEEVKQQEAEKRERDFVKSRDVFQAAMVEDASPYEKIKEREDLTRWQQSLSDEIEMTIHDLKREILVEGEWIPQLKLVGYDDEGKEVYHRVPMMMNEIGIRSFKAAVRPLMSRNLIMSNYSEEQLLTKLRGTISTFIIVLAQNFYDYDVRRQDISNIVRMFRSLVEPTHWRSYINGERRYLTTTHKNVEARNINMAQGEKKKGILAGVIG